MNAGNLGVDMQGWGKFIILQGEAMAVNFGFMLHNMPDESVRTINQRHKILTSVKSLFPKVVTFVKQETITNTFFIQRLCETFKYNTNVFLLVDVACPRDNKERIVVEMFMVHFVR